MIEGLEEARVTCNRLAFFEDPQWKKYSEAPCLANVLAIAYSLKADILHV